MTNCTCSFLQIGTKKTDHKNFNPDCPLHGFDSEWYQSKEETNKRQKQSERLRSLFAQSKQARQSISGSENQSSF